MKFYHYIYGKEVIIETDHKPLQAIFSNSILKAPKRLQRIMLSLKNYNIKIEWKPGNQMFVAD